MMMAGGNRGQGGRGPMGGGHGPGGMMMRGEKPRDFKGTMRRLLVYLAPYRWSFVVVILFATASTVFNILGPKILGKATTALFNGVMAGLGPMGMQIDFAYIGQILLTMAGLYLSLIHI